MRKIIIVLSFCYLSFSATNDIQDTQTCKNMLKVTYAPSGYLKSDVNGRVSADAVPDSSAVSHHAVGADSAGKAYHGVDSSYFGIGNNGAKTTWLTSMLRQSIDDSIIYCNASFRPDVNGIYSLGSYYSQWFTARIQHIIGNTVRATDTIGCPLTQFDHISNYSAGYPIIFDTTAYIDKLKTSLASKVLKTGADSIIVACDLLNDFAYNDSASRRINDSIARFADSLAAKLPLHALADSADTAYKAGLASAWTHGVTTNYVPYANAATTMTASGLSVFGDTIRGNSVVISFNKKNTGTLANDMYTYSYDVNDSNVVLLSDKWRYFNKYQGLLKGIDTINTFLCFYSRPYVQCGGLITNLIGFKTDPYFWTANATANITNVYGINAAGGAYGGSASAAITNWYQINIGNPTSGTNRYGIYINSISGGTLNYAIYSAGGMWYTADTVQTTKHLKIGTNTATMPASTGLFIDGAKSFRIGAGDGDGGYGGYINGTYTSFNGGMLLGSRHATIDYPTIQVQAGKVYIGAATKPTAFLHIIAGTVTVPPIKLTSGSVLNTLAAGSVEFLTDTLYFTQTTGTARKKFAFMNNNANNAVTDTFKVPTINASAVSISAKDSCTGTAKADSLYSTDGYNTIGNYYKNGVPWVPDTALNVLHADTADKAPWAGIGSTPTTLAGYGITDAAPLTHGTSANYIPLATSATTWGNSQLKMIFGAGTDYIYYVGIATPQFFITNTALDSGLTFTWTSATGISQITTLNNTPIYFGANWLKLESNGTAIFSDTVKAGTVISTIDSSTTSKITTKLYVNHIGELTTGHAVICDDNFKADTLQGGHNSADGYHGITNSDTTGCGEIPCSETSAAPEARSGGVLDTAKRIFVMSLNDGSVIRQQYKNGLLTWWETSGPDF